MSHTFDTYPATPEPLRVAVVSESPLDYISGVTRSVWHALEYLQEAQYPALAICPPPTPDVYANAPIVAARHLNLRGFNVGLSRPNGSGLISMLAEADFRPDVIHNASPFGPLGTAAVAAAERLDVPCVAVYQTNMPEYFKRSHAGLLAPWAKHHVASLHNRAALTLAPTNIARQDLVSWGVNEQLIAIWARGVDAKLFNPERRDTPAVQELRQQIAPHGEPIVGYVGRLAPEKQVGRLAALKGINAKVMVVGKGPEEAALRSQLDNAVFVGEKRDGALADAYSALDIFVHTGTNETFGQTLQEAMASGKPVVAPHAGGPIEIVHHEESGYLYNPDRDQGFRAYVEKLLDDQPLRTKMGETGRQLVLPRSWHALCETLVERHYRSAIHSSTAR